MWSVVILVCHIVLPVINYKLCFNLLDPVKKEYLHMNETIFEAECLTHRYRGMHSMHTHRHVNTVRYI